MPAQRIEFPGASGALLAARLDLPDAPARAYALFAHCFTCSKDTKAATYITKALVEADIAVLRFDFTGLGSSEGDFSNTNFSSSIEDLVAAASEVAGDCGQVSGASDVACRSAGGDAAGLKSTTFCSDDAPERAPTKDFQTLSSKSRFHQGVSSTGFMGI